MGTFVKIGEATAPKFFGTAADGQGQITGQTTQFQTKNGKFVKIGEATAPQFFGTSQGVGGASSTPAATLPTVESALAGLRQTALSNIKNRAALTTLPTVPKSTPTTADTNQRDLSQIKSELEAARSAEKSAMNRLNDYMLTYSGALDLRDPAELQALKDTATAATEARERLEQEYNAHEGSFEDQYGEFSGVEKAIIGIIGSPLAAVDVIAQTAKSAIGGDNTMDMDTLAMQNYKKAQQLKSSATENLSGPGKFLADTGISIAQNLYALPMNAVMPGGSLAVMGTTAAADKMAELGDQGESATSSLVRGAISGGIEAATEKIPLDSLADLVKTGGKSVIKNLLKQGGVEATEEGVAYAANYIADKLAKDPNATWDWADFANSVASGGVSGLFFGLGGTAINRVSNSSINSNGVFLPGSGLETPVQTQQTTQNTPTAPTQTATAPNVMNQTQDTVTQNAAPGATQAQNNTVPTAQAAADLLAQAAEQVAQGGTVTNSMAERILEDQDAVDALAEATGVTIGPTMTKAQQRAAVKNAVSELASREAGASGTKAGDAQAQKNTAPNMEAVVNAAGVTPAESETNAVSQLRPNGSGTTVSPEPIVTTTQEKVNQIVSAQLEKGKGYASVTELAREINAAIPDDTKAAADVFGSLLNSEEYGVNAAGQLYRKSADSHIDNRDIATVGSRSVKSFQFENPQLHSYFVEAAQGLKSDLANTTRGERFYLPGASDNDTPMEGVWSGIKRSTTKGIAELKDNWNLSYADIEQAADAIINDQGQENYAAAKRVEMILDDMLTNGYTDPTGFPVPPNENYIQEKSKIAGSNPVANTAGTEDIDPLPLVDGFGKNTVGSAQARFKYQEAPTQSVANDMFTEEEAEAHPELGGTTHKVYTNAESRADAQERLTYDYEYEKAALESEEWGAAETVMGYEILRDLTEAARESGDYSEVVSWKKMFDQKGTTAGQALQARKQFVEKPDYIIAEAAETLEGDNIRKMTDERKQKVLDTVREQAGAFDTLEEGDTAALIDLIKRNNEIRRTTGLFSKKTSKQMSWALDTVAEKYSDAEEFLRNVALSQIRSISSDYQKLSPLEAVKNYRVMGMLSKTSTIMRNLVSNNVFDPLESLSNNVGIIADALISKATGNRTTAVDKSWFSKAKRSGSLEGALKSFIQVGLDADVEGAASRYETSADRTFKMTGNPLERLLSTWSKYENYALKTTDEFQKGGINAETQRGIDKLKSTGKLDAEALPDWASETARQRTFQNDGAVANAMVGARSAMNNLGIKDSRGGSLGIGDVMLPFAKVPGNLVAQAANYSPLGIVNSFREITGVLIDAKKGTVSSEKQAQAARDFGRGVTGTGLLAGFAALAAMGLIDVAGDDDADKEALEKTQGRTGTQWNLSATLRAIKGESTEWQDDDTLLAIGFLDPVNAIMAAGALLSDAYSEDGKLTVKETADASFSSLVQAVLDLPAMSSISSLIDSYTYAEGETMGEKAANAAAEYAASQVSSFLLPNALKGIATGTDDTVRNQYAGETWQEDAANSIKAGLPMLRETLPASLDSFGREKTYTGNSLLDFLNANVLPGQVTKYNQTELEQEIERLNGETGATNIYPDKSAPTSVSYDSEKYTLTPEERYAYQQNFGQIAQDLMYSMAESSSYKSATDEEKAEMMSETLSFANDLAKREFLASRNVDYESSSWEKAYKIVDAGIDFSVYLEYKDQLSELKEASNTSTANSEIRRKIFSDSRLTQNQKSILDETILSDGIYIPKDVNVNYSSDESFIITQMSESAQKRWPTIKEKFSITAEQYVEAWSIYNQDGVSATEKKAALRELVGATQGNLLYTALGKDLD